MPVFDVFVAYRDRHRVEREITRPPITARGIYATSPQHAAMFFCMPEVRDAALHIKESEPDLIVVTEAGSAMVFDRDAIAPLRDAGKQMRIEHDERQELARLKAKYEP